MIVAEGQRRLRSDHLADAERITSADGRHLYWLRVPVLNVDPAERQRMFTRPGEYAQRALFVFSCPADGPQGPDDWKRLSRLMQGHGIGQAGAVFLFTDTEASATAPHLAGHTAVGPLADSALRAALRWLERPGFARLQSGRLVLCHGPQRSLAGQDRVAALWNAMRAFKRRAHGWGAKCENPLRAKPGEYPQLGFVNPATDGGPLPDMTGPAWWVWPRW